MSVLVSCFRAERVKWRKSWMLLTALLAPLCQVGFLFIIFWFSESRIRMFKPGFQFWLELNFVTWNLMLMPIATLEAMQKSIAKGAAVKVAAV